MQITQVFLKELAEECMMDTVGEAVEASRVQTGYYKTKLMLY
jgi:hypothetical protein